MKNQSDPEIISALLALTQAIERNTESNHKMQETLSKFFPEFKKTETVKRLKKNQKKLDADIRSTLDEMGLWKKQVYN